MTYEELEKKRKNFRNRMILCIIGFMIFLSTIFYYAETLGPYCIILTAIALPITFLFLAKPIKEYSKAYKEYFVLRSLKKYFKELKYDPDSGLKKETIADTKMIYMGNRYNSDDFISGKYKDVSFKQADVLIENVDQDSEKSSVTTIFKGRWMVFDFNKEFKSNIQVVQKKFLYNKLIEDDGVSYKKVEMESDSFNKRFDVYAKSEHEAFYILTPSIMEKLERLDDNNEGKLLLCFVDNKLHIGLYDDNDSFEPPSCMHKINEEKELIKTDKDIKIITQFIDELNLDNTLFKKTIIDSKQEDKKD